MTQIVERASDNRCPETTGLGRLPFRVDPMPLESVRGYFCRLAHIYRTGINSLGELAGLTQLQGLERDDHAAQIAYTLRLEISEWRQLCYKRTNGNGQSGPISFFGQSIGGDRLNYGHPRVCPNCLSECSVWWGIWDLGLVCVCPIHRCRLVNQCPACGRKLRWQRPAVHECRCQFDLRSIKSEPAESGLVAINAAMYRAAGFPLGPGEADLDSAGFAPAFMELQLDPLLRVISFVGSIQENGKVFLHQSRFASHFDAATQVDKAAAAALRNWPHSFHEILRRMVPGNVEDPATLRLQDTFGKSYDRLIRMFDREEFGFLHRAFEDFIAQHWKGFVRGQRRQDSQWIVAAEAGRLIGTRSVKALVHSGELRGIFIKHRRGHGSECWIRRESLNQWIADREHKRSCYMRPSEASRTLGLTRNTVLKLARAELIRYLKGAEHHLPGGSYLHREDVMKIKYSFQKHLPLNGDLQAEELMPLRSAIFYLGRNSGLPAVIRAVVAGTLVPLAHKKQLPGITGYCFPVSHLRKYRSVVENKTKFGDFLCHKEAASLLRISNEAVRKIAGHGFLGTLGKSCHGQSKLLSAVDVQRFANQYVQVSDLAKQFSTSSKWLGGYLERSGTQLLAVPLHESRKLFVSRHIAAKLRIPARRSQ